MKKIINEYAFELLQRESLENYIKTFNVNFDLNKLKIGGSKPLITKFLKANLEDNTKFKVKLAISGLEKLYPLVEILDNDTEILISISPFLEIDKIIETQKQMLNKIQPVVGSLSLICCKKISQKDKIRIIQELQDFAQQKWNTKIQKITIDWTTTPKDISLEDLEDWFETDDIEELIIK